MIKRKRYLTPFSPLFLPPSVVTYLLHHIRRFAPLIVTGGDIPRRAIEKERIMKKSANQIRLITLITAMCILMGCAGATIAADKDDEKNPHLWKPRVKSVSVFKNGLGFFLSEAETELDEGWCVSSQIPPAAFGTLAIFSHDEDKMVDIVGSGTGQVIEFDGVDAPDTEEARRERLEANMELNVQLTYKREDQDLTVAGRLRSIGPKYVILKAKSSNFAVEIDSITKMKILDLPIRVHLHDTSDEKKVPKKAKLGMAYLRKGVTWIPEYSLKILDEDTAELTLRGTLVNEAEDLIHCDVNFVVGVPHFVHTNYMAPIAVGQMIRTIGTAVAPQAIRSQIMNRGAIVRNTQRDLRVVDQPVPAAAGNLKKVTGSLPSLAGPGGTDYTVYTKKDLTVRKGEKAIVTLFRHRIKYSHIYRWSLPGKLQHNLVLHNSTPTAWTTGPCLAISDGRPLSEDLLKYVPRGASGELPVTTAINVATDVSETEIKRKLKAHSPRSHHYLDLVTLRGTIKVRNFEKRKIKVVVTQTVAGKPTEATEKGKIIINTQKLQLQKREGRIVWTIEVEPGKTNEMTYVYERYVPSG
jgi:hypothetical protein